MPTHECNHLTLRYADCVKNYMLKGEHLLGNIHSVNTVRFFSLPSKQGEITTDGLFAVQSKEALAWSSSLTSSQHCFQVLLLPESHFSMGASLVQLGETSVNAVGCPGKLSSAAQALPGLQFSPTSWKWEGYLVHLVQLLPNQRGECDLHAGFCRHIHLQGLHYCPTTWVTASKLLWPLACAFPI